ncbi:dolichyl-phosphate beta-glucosyltransferase [Cystoisospora suis]|uniref:Dolichyl-phosphate beta-glucosyltransferase n=1 Tax=Cystoisospora suis TaxID=483139 RepID=A0A2C6L3I8_9APIC|nr:dolichyl-phosphate beta-glucosyltransferase [Cystoisospora suis]
MRPKTQPLATSSLCTKKPSILSFSHLFHTQTKPTYSSLSVMIRPVLLLPALLLLISLSSFCSNGIYSQHTPYSHLLLFSSGASLVLFLLLRGFLWLFAPILQWKREEGLPLSSFLHLDHQPAHLPSSSSSLPSPESTSSSLPLSLSFPLVKAEEECLSLPPKLHLSVIIPAYNEALRLPSALCELIYHLESRRASSTQNHSLSSIYQTFFGLPTNPLHSLSASSGKSEAKENTICSSLSSPSSFASLDNRQNHSLSSTSDSYMSQDKKGLSVSSSEERQLVVPSREKGDKTVVKHVSEHARLIFEYEILIVDDGSQDDTSQIGPLLASAIYSASSSPSASQAAEAALYALDAIRSSSSSFLTDQVSCLSSSSSPYTRVSQDGFPCRERKVERRRKGEERKEEEELSSSGFSSKNERSSHVCPLSETPMNSTGRIERKERKKSTSSFSFFSLNHRSRKEKNEGASTPLTTYPSNPSPGDTSPTFQAVRAATFYHLQHSSSCSSSSPRNKSEGERKDERLPQESRKELSQEKDLLSNRTRTYEGEKEEGQRRHVLEGSKDRISCTSMNTRNSAHSSFSSLRHVLVQSSSSIPATSPSCIRVIRLRENKGKGFAVKTGVRFARGQVILMADADGATNVKDLEVLERSLEKLFSQEGQQQLQIQSKRKNEKINKRAEEGEGEEEEGRRKGVMNQVKPDALSSWEKTMEEQRQGGGGEEEREDGDTRGGWRTPVGVAFGSRRHLEAEALVSRAWYRNFLMHAFYWCVACVVGRGGGLEEGGREERGEEKSRSYCHYDIKDTQCGFKLFTRHAARLLFPYLHISRWAFDVELLLLSRLQKIPIVEVPVEWEEKDGSKLNILDASFQMARDLLILKLMYATGIWGGKGLRRLL